MIQKRKMLIASILILVLSILPLFVGKEYVLSIFCMLFLYITLSQSWNILGGFTGQVNVGQAAFFGIGALIARALWIAGFPFYLSIAIGGVGSVFLAVIIGLPALRLKGHYFAIGTLAVAWIAQITVGNMLPGISFLPGQYMAEYGLISRYYVFLIIMVGALITIFFTVNSKVGLGMEATRDDEEAAQTVGVNVFKYKVIAFALSSFFAGLAGGGFAYFHASYYWHLPFGLMWCFEPILIVFIGGVGSFIGPIVGSVSYVILKEIFALTLGEMNVLIFGVVFILAILFFPKGIIGLPSKMREFFKKGREPLLAGDMAEDKSKS